MNTDECASFARKVRFDDLGLAGAFADWLIEQGDKRGELLRRRWNRWRKELAKAQAELDAVKGDFVKPWQEMVERARKMPGVVLNVFAAEVVTHYGTQNADTTFRLYIMGKFPESWPPLHDDA